MPRGRLVIFDCQDSVPCRGGTDWYSEVQSNCSEDLEDQSIRAFQWTRRRDDSGVLLACTAATPGVLRYVRLTRDRATYTALWIFRVTMSLPAAG